ncbi:MAG: imidazolonepropionase [Actinomycetes bacterium]|nr:MAG: imidazolonepropionase [Actinomycetota bacterium]
MTGLFVTGIGHLTTNDGDSVRDAVVVVDDGRVSWAGPASDAPEAGDRTVLDCGGRAVIPGFVDAHTHLVFAGDRSDEFRRKMAGEDYRSIAASGGGIRSTVRATRQESEDELFELAAERLRRMAAAGTTAVEIKSGYGLDTGTETRLLRVARRVGEELGIPVRTTFLGAHAVPEGMDRDAYLDLLVGEMIPAVAGLADYCDVFVEDGAFTVDEAREILATAATHGMRARVHAEQLTRSGGALLAAELGAVSADHLDRATPEDAAALAAAGVAAVLCPGASYMLRSPQAPGPMLWEAGCVVAIATDCNPGTSYFESMAPIISLAVVQMGLTVEQAIWAATRGGALALEMPDRGIIRPGATGDLVVLDAPDPAHLPYRPGTDLVWLTIRSGDTAEPA